LTCREPGCYAERADARRRELPEVRTAPAARPGEPGDRTPEEHLHLVVERLSHRPSFECFGGHLELAPPVPQFWDIHWETVGDA
jgi:hypothetical protein